MLQSNHQHQGSKAEPEPCPTATQLWSVIEFSREFPDLTQFLAADINTAELSATQLCRSLPEEPLEFPSLVALDPKELRSQTQKRRQEEEQPAASTVPQQEEKLHFWRYLLTLFASLIVLFWLHDSGQVEQSAATCSTANQYECVPSTTCTPNFFSRFVFSSS